MGKEKSIAKTEKTSLDRASNQISIVNKILSEKQKKIIATRKTPEIILNPNGYIKIMGRSIPEDGVIFYQPIEKWILGYFNHPAEVTIVDIYLDSINGVSRKILIHLLERIKHVILKHKKFIFNWYYDEGRDDILDFGEILSACLDVPFNFIKISKS
jgi:hypothetical protein